MMPTAEDRSIPSANAPGVLRKPIHDMSIVLVGRQKQIIDHLQAGLAEFMMRAPEAVAEWDPAMKEDARRFVIVVAGSPSEAMVHVENVRHSLPQQSVGVVINALMPGDVAPLLAAGLNPVVAGPCSPRGLYRRVAETLQKGRLRLKRSPRM